MTPHRSLALAAALAALLPASALAATFTVTKTADTADGVCNADCSLREAVIAANLDAAEDTILIPAGTYTLSRAGVDENDAATGDLDVTQPATILGAGRDATVVDGGALDRVFDLRFQGKVEFRALRIRNGASSGPGGGAAAGFFTDVTMTACALSENTAPYGGGLSAEQQATVTLRNTLFEDNAATGTLYGGGGVFTTNGRGFDATACVFRGNDTNANGGAISAEGPVTIRDTTFDGNTAQAGGGAILTAYSQTEISGSTFANNSAVVYAGAILPYFTTLTLTNSTIVSNHVTKDTGSGDGNGQLGGGAIAINRFAASPTTLTNVTIADNTVAAPTVGPSTASGSALVCSDCMGAFTLRNTVIAGVGAVPLCQGQFLTTVPETEPVSLGGNLIADASCGLTDPTDQLTVTPGLGALASNGGLTKTRALTGGGANPAVQAGADCPTNDQRGFVRGASSCDAGAFESLTPANPDAFSCGGSYEGVRTQIEYIVEDLLPNAAADVGDMVFCLGGVAGEA